LIEQLKDFSRFFLIIISIVEYEERKRLPSRSRSNTLLPLFFLSPDSNIHFLRSAATNLKTTIFFPLLFSFSSEPCTRLVFRRLFSKGSFFLFLFFSALSVFFSVFGKKREREEEKK